MSNETVLHMLSPLIRQRVEVLMEFQCEHDELEAQFIEEKEAIQDKYQKLYQPFYTQRYEIVNEVVESSEENGVPDFWLTAMKNNEITNREIYGHDEGALKFLKDIKMSMIDDPKGFKLDFVFDTNPYFKNSVITKTYRLIDKDDPKLEKAIGTEIEWHTGKCLTKNIVRKKGSSMRIPKTVTCESFFNYFSPPEVPEDDTQDEAKALRLLMEEEYYVGHAIKDKIIPHAVSWFTGEALVESEDANNYWKNSIQLIIKFRNKLPFLQGKQPEVLDSLSPVVRKRVEVLREIQCKHDELVAQFFVESAVLEAKYQRLYQPLYIKRYEIVNGLVDTTKSEESSEEKGVPDFWYKAMSFNALISSKMGNNDDGEALTFLKDIKWYRVDDPKGFKLEFLFDTNRYFKNSVLTKTYHVNDEDEPLLKKPIGTKIEWHTGICLNEKIVRMRPKKGSHTRPSKTVWCKSFFDFFSPPEDNEDNVEELQKLMEQDINIGLVIRDEIIPHAVSWFTGDASKVLIEFNDYDEDAYSEGESCTEEEEEEEE